MTYHFICARAQTMAKCYDFDVRFKHPSNFAIIGPSQSGKSAFTVKLIEGKNKMFDQPPQRIIWAYGAGCYQPDIARQLPHVEFMEGLPNDVAQMLDPSVRTLFILDDLMDEINSEVSSLFTRYGHHRNCSVIFISQNLFNKNKETRTINLNTHYLILYKNVRDKSQIAHLGRQIFPNKGKYFMEAYTDACTKSYGYLLVDLRPSTPDELRLRTNIFSGGGGGGVDNKGDSSSSGSGSDYTIVYAYK